MSAGRLWRPNTRALPARARLPSSVCPPPWGIRSLWPLSLAWPASRSSTAPRHLGDRPDPMPRSPARSASPH